MVKLGIFETYGFDHSKEQLDCISIKFHIVQIPPEYRIPFSLPQISTF